MSVKKLNSDIRAVLRSGQVVPNFVKCVLELVYNSLDGNATAVAVRVNLKTFQIQVVDNGIGITRHDLERIGQRYFTSKCHRMEELQSCLSTFGYRGEAIASMVNICHEVNLQAKSKNEQITYEKTFLKGAPIAKVSVCRRDRPSAGVTVTLQGVLYNQPVRQKRLNPALDVEHIRTQMDYLSLIFSHVSFSLRDDHTALVLLQTSKSQRKEDVFGLALTHFLVEIEHNIDDVMVSGFFSKERHHDRTMQYVYVNRRIVNKTKIHELVNVILDKYMQVTENANRPENVFLIRVNCPYLDCTVQDEGPKTTVEFKNRETVLKCVFKAIKSKLSSKSASDEKKKVPEVCFEQFSTRHLAYAVRGGLAKRKPGAALKTKQTGEGVPGRVLRETNHTITNVVVNRKVYRSTNRQLHNELPESPTAFIGNLTANLQNKQSNTVSTINAKAPLFNLSNAFQQSLHEFQAWLFMKAQTDLHASRLLNEYHSFLKRAELKSNGENTPGPNKNLLNLQSVREMRKQKMILGETNKEQLKTVVADANIRKRVKHKDRGIEEWCHQQDRKKLKTSHAGIKKKVAKDAEKTAETQVVRDQKGPATRTEADKRGDVRGRRKALKKAIKADPVLSTRKSLLKSLNLSTTPSASELIQRNLLQLRNKQTNKRRHDIHGAESTPVINTWDSHPQVAPPPSVCLSMAVLPPDTPTPEIVWDEEYSLHSVCEECDLSEGSPRRGIMQRTVAVQTVELHQMQPVQQVEESRREKADDSEDETFPSLSFGKNPVEQGTCVPETPGTEVSETYIDVMLGLATTQKGTVEDEEPGQLLDGATEMGTELPGAAPHSGILHSTTNHQFPVSTRFSFVPRGFSPILRPSLTPQVALSPSAKQLIQETVNLRDTSLEDVKWCNTAGDAVKPLMCRSLASDLRDKAMQKLSLYEPQVLSAAVSSGATAKVHNLLNSFTLTKHLFSGIKVIGQLDKKFIVAVGKEDKDQSQLIVLFDQHAVDERIRLENLTKEFQPDGVHFTCGPVEPPLDIILTPTQIRVLLAYRTKLQDYGLCIEPGATNEGLTVNSVPTCLLKTHERERRSRSPSWLQDSVYDLLDDLADTLLQTRGVLPTVPRVIQNAISSEACHGAIKFNHNLTALQMASLLQGLQACQLPFQCAHGRPSVVPLLNISHLAPTWVSPVPTKQNFRGFLDERRAAKIHPQ